jgi:uncharacterized membrane protein YfcA
VLTLVQAIAAGAAAGCLGSLLGLGGGIFLVPFFQFALGLPFATAAGISLMSVIGTSVAVSTMKAGREFTNARLAITLQLFTALGATAGSVLLRYDLISNRTAERVFGITAALIAVVLLRRLDARVTTSGATAETGSIGGRYFDPDRQETVAYRVRRTPVALTVSFAAGIVSTLSGIGGGVLIVPALNSWCGVPLRVAAATSTFVIGVTAVPGVIERFPFNDAAAPALAAAAVIGVLIGSRAGAKLGPQMPVRALKMMLSGILLIVAVVYLVLK